MSRIEPLCLKMQWQTKENGADCKVFAMRHMETYFGGGTRNWESQITPESVSILLNYYLTHNIVSAK